MKKHLPLLASVPLMIGLALSAARGEEKSPALVMQFSSPKTFLQVKEQPQVSVSITNKGEKPVTLVLPGDGSESGWRTPIVNWSVIEASSKAKHPTKAVPQRVLRCGNINPLKADEVFVLAPGESKELKNWIYLEPFAKAGKYNVVFLYANRPTLKWSGLPLGEHDAKAMERVKNSTECSLVSNEVSLTIRG